MFFVFFIDVGAFTTPYSILFYPTSLSQSLYLYMQHFLIHLGFWKEREMFQLNRLLCGFQKEWERFHLRHFLHISGIYEHVTYKGPSFGLRSFGIERCLVLHGEFPRHITKQSHKGI